jgi:arginase
MAHFVIAPQWQGSGSARAMQLIDGAEAIAGDLPASACTRLEVPVEAGESLDTGIRRASSLGRIRDLVRDAVAARSEPVVVIGGDCGVSLGALEAVAAEDIAVVWLDAHADLNTPESSPSGAFCGMVLRAALGDGADRLRLARGILTPDRVVLAGTRELDDAEQQYIDEHSIRRVLPGDLADPEALVAAVADTGASRVYIHIDLDVLDPSVMTGVSLPVPFGPTASEVIAAVRALRDRFPLAGATIAEFSPASADAAIEDMPTILRLVGAVA